LQAWAFFVEGEPLIDDRSQPMAREGDVLRLITGIPDGSQEVSARSATIRASNRVAALLISIRQMSFREAREAGRIKVSRS